MMSEDPLKRQASVVAVIEKAKISFLKCQKTKIFIDIVADMGNNGSC